ncbi:MAG: hypothetical protein A3I05_02170 [Deltaproteobacteria bacterium RIFCSPLOWO2_02_FULL_44_10]|nr:MAG: hypothetical protein A3C46_08335 [Deltaproteobacteria bacterium RIFCSPHIGHO2_02_FULL_44_16]OGQ47584.1 MAG: hypothetical protein A3I05_02170 [Deltaproteobacteria bacterium RIFCSPLOWO2_02_FULL_44_10]
MTVCSNSVDGTLDSISRIYSTGNDREISIHRGESCIVRHGTNDMPEVYQACSASLYEPVVLERGNPLFRIALETLQEGKNIASAIKVQVRSALQREIPQLLSPTSDLPNKRATLSLHAVNNRFYTLVIQTEKKNLTSITISSQGLPELTLSDPSYLKAIKDPIARAVAALDLL